MLLLGCSLGPLISPQVQCCRNTIHVRANIQAAPLSCLRRANSEFFGPDISSLRTIVAVQSRTQRIASFRKLRRPSAFWMPCSQIASSAFTWGTVTVLPFYTLMVLAPNGGLTKKSMESNIPYIALGVLYAYLLYLSWTPDTIRLMFSSKYWLPELAGMVRMFSSEMTLASAWIHLLAVDLFAARQIFHDGLKNNIETRHSVSFCLLFCPIGILVHAITKALTLHKDQRVVPEPRGTSFT